MALETGAFMQASSYSAEIVRRAMFAQYARTSANSPGIISGGLIGSTDFQITQLSSPNMSVNVSTGEAIVPGNEGGSQGGYYVRGMSTTNLAISTANPSNPRVDTVCLTCGDAQYTLPSGGTSGSLTLQVVTGTPTSGASLSNLSGAAALPASSLLLGYVLVPAGASSIVTADIANKAQIVAIGSLQLFGHGVGLSGSPPAAVGVSGWLAQMATPTVAFSGGVSTATVSFPSAFPNSLLGVICSSILQGSTQPAEVGVSSTNYGLLGFTAWANVNGSAYTGNLTFSYLAIGA